MICTTGFNYSSVYSDDGRNGRPKRGVIWRLINICIQLHIVGFLQPRIEYAALSIITEEKQAYSDCVKVCSCGLKNKHCRLMFRKKKLKEVRS